MQTLKNQLCVCFSAIIFVPTTDKVIWLDGSVLNVNAMIKQKLDFLQLLKLILFLACVSIFCKLSYNLFVNYQTNKKIVTTAKQKMGTVPSPVIMVCSQVAFKNNSLAMLELVDYMMNTINVTEEILLDYKYFKLENHYPSKVRAYLTLVLHILQVNT